MAPYEPRLWPRSVLGQGPLKLAHVPDRLGPVNVWTRPRQSLAEDVTDQLHAEGRHVEARHRRNFTSSHSPSGTGFARREVYNRKRESQGVKIVRVTQEMSPRGLMRDVCDAGNVLKVELELTAGHGQLEDASR